MLLLTAALTLSLLSPLVLPAGETLTGERARNFVLALAAEAENLADFQLPEERARAERLGISYEGVRNKFLIGYGLDPAARELILRDFGAIELKVEKLSGDYALASLRLPQLKYERVFYFKGAQFISPVYYFTRDWPRRASRYFSFYLSNLAAYNSYAASRLDNFVETMLDRLGASAQDKERLAREKIIYVLCRDENQIEELTGFKLRGMCVLSHDYVVTTCNCHCHEVLHLLVNFRLKNLPLTTHSFLREGLASAFGGRGGKEPQVILDLGYFLVKSGFVELESLLDERAFGREDPSLAYPAGGIYNRFLFEELGAAAYLDLYRKYSRTQEPAKDVAWLIDKAGLPAAGRWEAYLERYPQFAAVLLDQPGPDTPAFLESENVKVYDTGQSYFFRLKGAVALGGGRLEPDYQSAEYRGAFSGAEYRGEKYLIRAGQEEIGVYNLYTDNLIANYVGTFCLVPRRVPQKDGWFEFGLLKSVFDEPLER